MTTSSPDRHDAAAAADQGRARATPRPMARGRRAGRARGDARQHGPHQPRLPLAGGRGVPLLPTGAERPAQHAGADRAVDGDRHRRRHRARDHAAVAEPGALQRLGGLHLAVPRHTADRAAALLELPGRALPAARAGHPVRPGVHLVRHEPADQPVRGMPARPRPQRGGLHGRDRARRAAVGGPMASRKRRARWACPGRRRCGGSCCPRPCG